MGSKLPLTFGAAIPQVVEGREPSAADLSVYAQRAEELGYARLWVSELTSAPILDPLHVLSFAAGATSTIGLGVAIILAPLRIPLQLARDVATLDRLSAGRLVLGLGFGSNEQLYPRYGLSAERRLSRYEQILNVLPELWSGMPVSAATEFWDLEGVTGLATHSRPHPPLWFGARRGPALRRVAERGDGWIVSGSAPPEEFTTALYELHDHLTELGREASGFPIAARVYLALTDDRERELRRLEEWFGANYGNPEMAHRVAVVGDADDLAGELAAKRDLGVNHLLLNPVFDEANQIEALATDVLPKLA